MTLTRNQILQSEDLPRELVEVPEWGGSVWVKSLTGKERDALEAVVANIGEDGKAHTNLVNLRARLGSLTMTDEKGKRLFTDGDVKGLGEKSAAALDRVFSVAQRLAKLTDKDVKSLEKNS